MLKETFYFAAFEPYVCFKMLLLMLGAICWFCNVKMYPYTIQPEGATENFSYTLFAFKTVICSREDCFIICYVESNSRLQMCGLSFTV